MYRNPYKAFVYVLIMSLFLTVMGCAGLRTTPNYGMIIPDADVTEAFERYEINPGLNYYTSGPDLYPNALIGLDKSCTLESDLWKKAEFTPQTFRALVMDMQSRALQINDFQHGFAILDDKGRPIGVWYSILSARTWVKMAGAGSVVIATPDLGIYEKPEKDLFGMPPLRH